MMNLTANIQAMDLSIIPNTAAQRLEIGLDTAAAVSVETHCYCYNLIGSKLVDALYYYSMNFFAKASQKQFDVTNFKVDYKFEDGIQIRLRNLERFNRMSLDL